MSFIVTVAGQSSAPVRLGDVLLDIHRTTLERIEQQHKQRQNRPGVPESEATDWAAVDAALESACAAAKLLDEASVSMALEKASAAVVVGRPTIAPPDQEWVSLLNGVTVRLKSISDADYAAIHSEIAVAAEQLKRANGLQEQTDALVKVSEAQSKLVDAGVASIIGLHEPSGAPLASLVSPFGAQMHDAFRRSGLHRALYSAAEAYQQVPPGKAPRFGRSQPST